MPDKFEWLGKQEEIDFLKNDFRGRQAGLSWKYTQHLEGLHKTRAMIFFMALMVFYPIISNYLFHGVFSTELFVERFIFSIVLILAGLLFNKFRISSLILASIPLFLILLAYLFQTQWFSFLRIILFYSALIMIFLFGIYRHIKLNSLRKELEQTLLENQLIE